MNLEIILNVCAGMLLYNFILAAIGKVLLNYFLDNNKTIQETKKTFEEKLSEKLNVAFADNPQLLDRIDKGIEAGNILYIPNKYPGAAVQTNLLHGKFADFVLRKTPTAIGGWVGGGPGAVGGEMLGEKLSNAAAVSRQRKMLQKEIKSKGTPLNEVDEFKIKD